MATGLPVRFVALLVRFTGKVAQSKTRFRQHALNPIPGGTQVLPSARCFLQACLWRAEFFAADVAVPGEPQPLCAL